MISSNPKLPQLGPGDAGDYVAQSFWARFQERFYTLWRELTTAMEKLIQGPATSTDNQVLRFDGTSGKLAQGSDVYVTDDGRLYGTALHNNAGAVTGTTNQYVASGTYTPTLTTVDNCDSASAFQCQWMRVGNVVTVSGLVQVDATSTVNAAQFRATLPIASSLTNPWECGGVGRGPGLGATAVIYGDYVNDRAFFSVEVTSANSQDVYFTFTYLVL